MPSDSFCLAAQARLDSKWLKTDIQLAFTRDGLCGLWNEMVKDGEIVYTGTESTQNGDLPPRKDDSVEPSGTKKEDMNDKEKKDEEETPAPVYRAKSILESWVWGKQPDVNELKECLSVLVKEQQALAVQSATTTLSALRLKQRLLILERYFIAFNIYQSRTLRVGVRLSRREGGSAALNWHWLHYHLTLGFWCLVSSFFTALRFKPYKGKASGRHM